MMVGGNQVTRKTIVVGVTGGIAAYKTAELVSRLVKKGYDVYVVMTSSAQEFVAPLTFRTLSGNPVLTDMFEEPKTWNVQHVSLGEKADLFLIVPATANMIGKIAHGLADDLLSTTVLAATCPVLLAPAMNVNMWNNPIFQDNIKRLMQFGYHIVEPGTGRLACGTTGKGRLADLEEIEQKVEQLLDDRKDFHGRKILITAGPTREALDPVRFLSNHSTGRMGYDLACAARTRGAEVFLVSGPTSLPDPAGVTVKRVVSAWEMYQAVMARYPLVDIVIKTAAVADYRPKEISAEKIKKQSSELVLTLEKNPDILLELGYKKEHQILVGFAAETQNVVEYAREKMVKKSLNMVVANNVAEEGAGFGGNTNRVTIITNDGEVIQLPQLTKFETAHAILDRIRLLKNFN